MSIAEAAGLHSNIRPRQVAAFLAVALLGTSSAPALSDEGGVPFWLSGSYSSSMAVPAQPGWYLPTQLYFYQGGVNADQTFQRGTSIYGGINSQLALLFLSPTWVPDAKWFGGTPSFTLTFGGGWNRISGQLSISSMKGSTGANSSQHLWGGTDLYPEAQIAWNRGNHNWMGYMTGDLPIGSYQTGRLANIGLGHAAYDFGGAYTYLNTTGTEASCITGLTFNGTNPNTNVQSGIDWHLDYDVSQFLTPSWQVGVVGYVYYQLTNDSGSGNQGGSFRSGVAAVGGELGYTFTAFGLQWYANARGYGEFWAQDRLKGFAVFASLAIPLG